MEIAAGHQNRHAMGKFKQAPDAIAQRNRHGDHRRNAENEAGAGLDDRAGADRCTEKRDGNFQKQLGGKIDALVEPRAGAGQAAHSSSQKDCNHKRFQPCPPRIMLLDFSSTIAAAVMATLKPSPGRIFWIFEYVIFGISH